MPLRTCLILTFPFFGSANVGAFFGPRPGCQTNVRGMLRGLPRFRARTVLDRRGLHATLASDLLHGRQLPEAVERRQHHVVGIRRAEALRENVRDAGALHDGADGTAGDHAGTRGGGLHEHATRAVLADDLVRNRAAGQRDLRHVTPCAVDGLANRLGHFVCLAGREAHASLTVTDGHERVEREPTTAFYDFGNAIDGDDVLDQLTAFAIPALTATAAIAAATPFTAPATAAARTAPAATAAAAARTATTAAATR